jgi:hypothetical protein
VFIELLEGQQKTSGTVQGSPAERLFALAISARLVLARLAFRSWPDESAILRTGVASHVLRQQSRRHSHDRSEEL